MRSCSTGRVPDGATVGDMHDPRSLPMTAFQERLTRIAAQWLTGMNSVAYRLSSGRAAGHVGDAALCLLTTIGRRSGRPRTVVLLCLPYGDDLIVVASRGGMNVNPAWYLNLTVHPRAKVQVGAEVRAVLARDATAEERASLWPRLTAAYTYFDSYRARTARTIPVVLLSPA